MFEIVGLCVCCACLSLVCCFATGAACLISPLVEIRNNYLQKRLPEHVNWLIGVACTENDYSPQTSKRLDKRSPLLNTNSTICCMHSDKCPRNIRMAESACKTDESFTNEVECTLPSNQPRVSVHRTEMELQARRKIQTASELAPNQISHTALASKSVSRENTTAVSISNALFQDRILLKRIPENGVPSNETAADTSIRLSKDETEFKMSSELAKTSDKLFVIKRPSLVEDTLRNVSAADIALRQPLPVADLPQEDFIRDTKTVDKLSPRKLSNQLSQLKSSSNPLSKSGKLGRLFSTKMPRRTSVNTESILKQNETTHNRPFRSQNLVKDTAQSGSDFGKLSQQEKLSKKSDNADTPVATVELKTPVAFEISPRRKTL